MLKDKKIIVVVSGGIAAYKSIELCSRLRKAGAQVRVVMTEAATKFVAPLSFEAICNYPVYKNVFEQASSWEMEHISWARWADGIVVAPATANLIAKAAHGLADDAASTLLLATRTPVWLAPAMNTAMWEHPATQENLATLNDRGYTLLSPASGMLACGEEGAGRMVEPAEIVTALEVGLEAVTQTGPLAGKTILITTGPTREMLDPIRFISNSSSGRMGLELAHRAQALGAHVIAIHGPMSIPFAGGIETVAITTARDLLAAVQAHWERSDIAIFAAAVANYESATTDADKIKGGETLTIEMQRTPDVAAWGGAHRRTGQLLVGFCAESQRLLETAAEKLAKKQLDLICANKIGEPGIGFASEDNQVTILDQAGNQTPSPRASKAEVARWIWEHILTSS